MKCLPISTSRAAQKIINLVPLEREGVISLPCISTAMSFNLTIFTLQLKVRQFQFLWSLIFVSWLHVDLFKVTYIWHQWEWMHTLLPHLQHACCWIKDVQQTVSEMNTKEVQALISWIGGCGNSSLVTDGQLFRLRARRQKVSSQWFLSQWACSVTT